MRYDEPKNKILNRKPQFDPVSNNDREDQHKSGQ